MTITRRVFVLWGTPQGETDPLYERPLAESSDSDYLADAQRRASADGWHSFRRAPLDFDFPDFRLTVNL